MAAKFKSVAEMILYRVSTTPNGAAFEAPAPGGGWLALTWREVGERVKDIACGLRAIGLGDEERCSILATTRLEWILADHGITAAGGATTTIYPSNTPDECAYIIKDSATRFVFAENAAQVKKLVEKRADLPEVKHVIVIEGELDKPEDAQGGWVISFEELMKRGREYDKANPGKYEAVARAVKPESLATLIYTSGTTGLPKGVELTHDCWLFESQCIEDINLIHPEDKQYLWLPLSHVFGKVLEVAQLQIGFCTAVDGRIDKLVANLGEVKPTFVAAVPRIFEKVHNVVVQKAKEGGALKWRIFRWAIGVGKQVSKLKQAGKEPGMLLALQNGIADRLVFGKIKARFGGRLRFFVSGSAPLSRELTEFFHAAGILICEGYGLTESSAASFVNRPDKYRFGTVGVPLPGIEIKLAPADGEILIRGRGIMRGYHNLPDVTRESLDSEGWLHTGDIGVLQSEGFLQITDRKKDLIKTSGGKYVAPQAVEGQLKVLCPYLSQVVVHGNNRNYCSALVTLDEESIKKWGRENGLGEMPYADLTKNEKVRALIGGYVDSLNKKLPSYETLKKFAILPADLSLEAGELTPSLKVKRKVVEQKYQQVLDGFYKGAMESV